MVKQTQMADSIPSQAGLLVHAKPETRDSIVSGIRWTFWLSALSVPFSFGTTILLARISPEVIGTFGLLQIYIAGVAGFLFLGGNAVLIKFVPELSAEKRVSFFASYFVVNCAALIPWMLAASLWPEGLRYIFGKGHTGLFWVVLLYLSPIYILYSASLAALNGMLQMKWSQGLDRMVTVGSFAVYVTLYFAASEVLEQHYSGVIWGVYLALILIVACVAIRRFLKLNPESLSSGIEFFLPRGFWRYTLSLQGSSVLNFFSGRLDYVLLLYFGGLRLLGEYVALMTLLAPISKIVQFFLNSLLPSLTNTLAQGDLRSCEELSAACTRIVVPASLIMAGVVVLFAHPIVLLLGSKYFGLERLLWVAAPFAVIQAVGWVTANILNAAGKPEFNALGRAARIALFLTLFFPMWRHYHLMGVVLTWGICESLCHLVTLVAVVLKAPFRFHFARTYWPSAIALVGLPLLATQLNGAASPGALFCALLVLVLAYLLLAGYSPREIRALAHFVLPEMHEITLWRTGKP